MAALCGNVFAGEKNDKEAIEALLNESYLDGMYLKQDSDLVRNGFHPEFRLAVRDGEAAFYVPLEDWIEYEGLDLPETEKSDEMKAKRTATLRIDSIDIVGAVASVKAEVRIAGKITYTNFYGLVKTEGRWQVMTKHFATHQAH